MPLSFNHQVQLLQLEGIPLAEARKIARFLTVQDAVNKAWRYSRYSRDNLAIQSLCVAVKALNLT